MAEYMGSGKMGVEMAFREVTLEGGTEFGKRARRGGRISGNRRKLVIFFQKNSAACGGQRGAF